MVALSSKTDPVPTAGAAVARSGGLRRAAVLALVTHEDTHEVKNDADKPLWQQQSKDFQKEMTAAATAFKAKDLAGAKKAFDAANKACNECHKKFRDKE